MADFKLTPAREKELEKIAKDLPDSSFKKLYGKDWKSVKIATAMNILKKKYGFKEETKMKFKELREKMSGSKLTGQEISTWYRKNKDVEKAARKDRNIKKAVEIALDHGGAMNYAIKKIEKIKRGLADNPYVAKALSFANFGEEKTLEDGAGENSAAAQYAKDTPGQTPIGEETLTEGVKKLDPLDRAERVLNYKLKELQYKAELRRFNEFEEDKAKQYRMEANNAPLAKRAEKRFKGADKRLAQRIANAVKPGRVIQSKLYVELGDLWDKGDKKGFEKHLKKHEKK